MKVLYLVVCACIIGSARSHFFHPRQTRQAGGRDLDSLIKEVFNKPNTGNDDQVPAPQIQPNPVPSNNNPLDCECVPYYLCQNNTIITDGVGLIDIRIRDGPCESYLDVCCQKPLTEPITPTPNIRAGCGKRNPEGVGFRITGQEDNEAQFGEFPWMVAVLRAEKVDNGQVLNVYQCGGSLIHQQVVITAAHCVVGKDPRVLKIRAGEWDTQTKNELYPHQDRQVAKVIVHEKYYAGALYNDVALLFLDQPLDFAENVDVVCLPNQGEIFDHSRCFASGWGKDVFGGSNKSRQEKMEKYNSYTRKHPCGTFDAANNYKCKEGQYQVILKRVELPVVSHNPCEEALRKTRLGPYFKLHESFICAGGEGGRDTCKGDGGSPLVCPLRQDPTRYAQAGIVAWGIGCGEDGTPGVYANVALFRNWIDEQLVFNGLDVSLYSYQ